VCLRRQEIDTFLRFRSSGREGMSQMPLFHRSNAKGFADYLQTNSRSKVGGGKSARCGGCFYAL